MMGRTHLLAGAAVGALVFPANPLLGMVAAGVAALLPDIDSPGSTMGRKVWPVAATLRGTVGHRTLTHTVWFCGLVAVLGAFVGSRLHLAVMMMALAGFLGSASHLVLDGLTVSGVQPFLPAAWHPRGIFRTGRLGEYGVMLAFLILDVYLAAHSAPLAHFFRRLGLV
ncbi:MAG TPA: metal-dependent hydrolase [Spirochaetia bacterium]|nr:metal-dependent hydrolase [Spirochaetia bacterium]